MKKITTLLLATAIVATPVAGARVSSVLAEDESDVISIAVPDDFGDANILTATERNASSDWIYTMTCDRLFGETEVGNTPSESKFTPELALDWDFYEIDDVYDEIFPDAPDREPIDIDFEIPAVIGSAAGSRQDLLAWCAEDYISGWSKVDYSLLDSNSNFLTTPDLLGIEIHLRDGVKFQDNSDFNADSVVYLWQYALVHPSTLINKLWSHVYKIDVLGEYDIVLRLAFRDESYGFMDFMHDLASPIGSIAMPNGSDLPIGTGAYRIVSCENNVQVQFERNDEWWRGTVPTQNVKFICIGDSEACIDAFNLESVDFAGTDYIDENSINREGYDIHRVADNPLMCLYNTNRSWSNAAVRDTLTSVFYEGYVKNACKNDLLYYSNDYWATRYEENYSLSEDDVRDKIAQTVWWLDNVLDVEIIVDVNNDLGCDIAEKFADMANKWINALDFSVTALSSDLFDSRLQSGNYDMAIIDVDLNNPDAAYNTLYGSAVPNLDKLLNATHYAADLPTFWTMQFYSQVEMYYNSVANILGWNCKTFVQSDRLDGIKIGGINNITIDADQERYPGISLTGGPNVYSDVNYIDFRWINKI